MAVELLPSELRAIAEAVERYEKLTEVLDEADLNIVDYQILIEDCNTDLLGRVAFGECGSPCFIVEPHEKTNQ